MKDNEKDNEKEKEQEEVKDNDENDDQDDEDVNGNTGGHGKKDYDDDQGDGGTGGVRENNKGKSTDADTAKPFEEREDPPPVYGEGKIDNAGQNDSEEENGGNKVGKVYKKAPKPKSKPNARCGTKRAQKLSQKGLAARTQQQGIIMTKVNNSIIKYVEAYNLN